MSGTGTTLIFQHCLGVFEGGGVKGVALAGAYKEAHARGVRFSRVAGTSAGSIIAALIAAGASPADIEAAFVSKPLAQLLRKPDGKDYFKQRPARWLAILFIGIVLLPAVALLYRSGPYQVVSGIAFAGSILLTVGLLWRKGILSAVYHVSDRGGRYSAAGLQTWVSEMLLELIEAGQLLVENGQLKRTSKRDPRSNPVKFKELTHVPLYIVATDLRTSRPKVWSTRRDPEGDVAFAVASSCSIPLFFQPNRAGDALYVDGGTLSNVPGFSFFVDSDDGPSPSELILAFRLSGRSQALWDSNDKPKSIADFLVSLTEAVVAGASEIQLELLRNVFEIRIPTGKYHATDFDLKTEDLEALFGYGLAEAAKFFKNERALSLESVAVNVGPGRTGWLQQIVRGFKEGPQRVRVASMSATWGLDLLPVLLVARLQASPCSIEINVPRLAHTAADEQDREGYCRYVLWRLGAEVREVVECSLEACSFEFADGRVFAGLAKTVNHELQWVASWGHTPLPTAAQAYMELLGLCAVAPAEGGPTLSPGSYDAAYAAYRKANSSFYEAAARGGRAAVPLSAIRVVERVARAHLVEAWSALRDHLKNSPDSWLAPWEIRFADGITLHLFPPVLERLSAGADSDWCAMDEATAVRCYIESLYSASDVTILQLETSRAWLYGTPIPLSTLRRSERDVTKLIEDEKPNFRRTPWPSQDYRSSRLAYEGALRVPSVVSSVTQPEVEFLEGLRDSTRQLLGRTDVDARIGDALYLIRYSVLSIVAARTGIAATKLDPKFNANLMVFVDTAALPDDVPIYFHTQAARCHGYLLLTHWSNQPLPDEAAEIVGLPAHKDDGGILPGAPFAHYYGRTEFVSTAPERIRQLLDRDRVSDARAEEVVAYFRSHPRLAGFVTWPVPDVATREMRRGVVNVHCTFPNVLTETDVQLLERLPEFQRLLDSLGRDAAQVAGELEREWTEIR